MAVLTLAIPSKGRLKENCNSWFAERGVVMEQAAGDAEVLSLTIEALRAAIAPASQASPISR